MYTFQQHVKNTRGLQCCLHGRKISSGMLRKDDPYHILGIEWGATNSQIKEAFHQKAKNLHPDVNKVDSPKRALEKFQRIQKAYSKLMDVKGTKNDDWSFTKWRTSDIIAQKRDDVAGAARKRPIKPADSLSPNSKWGVASLGHPSGSGNYYNSKRSEFLGDNGKRSSTVGDGRNKWVKPKQLKPFDPESIKVKKISKNFPRTIGTK